MEKISNCLLRKPVQIRKPVSRLCARQSFGNAANKRTQDTNDYSIQYSRNIQRNWLFVFPCRVFRVRERFSFEHSLARNYRYVRPCHSHWAAIFGSSLVTKPRYKIVYQKGEQCIIKIKWKCYSWVPCIRKDCI